MRRDFWLNGAIITQVSITLVLTSWLWLLPFGRQLLPTEGTQVTRVPTGNQVFLTELVRPEQFLAHFGDGAHAAVPSGTQAFGELWDDLRPMLVNTSVLHSDEWQYTDGRSLNDVLEKAPAIEVDLAGALSLGDWVRQWGGSMTGFTHNRTPIDRVIALLGPESSLYFSGPDGVWKAPGLSRVQADPLWRWLQSLERKELVAYRRLQLPEKLAADPAVFVPDPPPNLRAPRLQALPQQPRDLEAAFFPDLSVVREITEEDGAMVYTDGQKYLRLATSGAMEYRAPEVPARAKPTELDASLRIAAQFVAEHGGWPSGLLLTGATQIDTQTNLAFGRSVGTWTLVGSEPLLQVAVSAGRVVEIHRYVAYSSLTVAERPERAAISAEAALAAVLTAPQGVLRLRLRGEYFAYAYIGGSMLPVWRLQFSDHKQFLVNARNGQLIG